MNKSSKLKLGWGLIVLACLCWLFLIAIPFLPNMLLGKAGLAVGTVIVGEVFFWLGTLLIGKEVWQSYKEKWRNKKRNKND